MPEGQYLFMGDNRNDSEDSRFPIAGFVPDRNLARHAVRIRLNRQVPAWPGLESYGHENSLSAPSEASVLPMARDALPVRAYLIPSIRHPVSAAMLEYIMA